MLSNLVDNAKKIRATMLGHKQFEFDKRIKKMKKGKYDKQLQQRPAQSSVGT